MKQTETAKLLAVIKTAYPHFEITETVIRLWHDFMQDMPLEKAQLNLKEHIRSNHFPPTIADVVCHEPEVFADYDRIKLDTQTYLQQREEWQRKAIGCPPHLSRKHLTAGRGDVDE